LEKERLERIWVDVVLVVTTLNNTFAKSLKIPQELQVLYRLFPEIAV